MVEITTCQISQMGRHKSEGSLVLDVTVKSAKGKARDLAPEWSWVKAYMDGRMSEEEYTSQYQKKMRMAYKVNPERWENTLRNHKRIVFACYCKPGDFCHRILLASYFKAVANKLGIPATVVPEGPPPPPEKRNPPRTFSENITSLEKDEVFVFGSNESGFHGAGTAGQAMRDDPRNTWRSDKKFQLAMSAPAGHPDRIGHWAVFGIGRGHQVGLNGESYAIATVERAGAKRSRTLSEIKDQLKELFSWAAANPNKTIYCAINGGGLNGYSKKEIASAYPTNIPSNVLIPEEIYNLQVPKENIYAGVGSRKTPERVLKLMEEYSALLANKGFVLRSGGAKHADTAFENGCDKAEGQKEIFRSQDATDWARELVQKYIPANRNWNRMRPYIQGLLARNMMQMLGADGNKPVKFIVCWTKDGKDSGGTGYIIRAAQDKGIPVYNLRNINEHAEFRKKVLNL